MPRFPPPNDIVFIILEDGKIVPAKSLPKEELERCCEKMMENVGKAVSACLAREAMELSWKRKPTARKDDEAHEST